MVECETVAKRWIGNNKEVSANLTALRPQLNNKSLRATIYNVALVQETFVTKSDSQKIFIITLQSHRLWRRIWTLDPLLYYRIESTCCSFLLSLHMTISLESELDLNELLPQGLSILAILDSITIPETEKE